MPWLCVWMECSLGDAQKSCCYPQAHPSLRIPEVEVQCHSAHVPVCGIAGAAVLSLVICLNHEKTLVRPLDPCGIPFFVPGMLRTVVEDLSRTEGAKMKAVNKKAPFDRHHVPIGRRVRAIDPPEFDPIPVAYQDLGGEEKAGRHVDSYAVLVFHYPRLSRSKELIASAEHKIVLFVRINI